MEITPTALPEVLRLTPRRFGDARGWFMETFSEPKLEAAGHALPRFVQDNHSYSARKHTLRGLHYQAPPMAQAKLVRCTRGEILDVAVDVRRGSPTYGRWVAERLSAEDGAQLFIPVGFLHGFVTLSDDCEVQYKCSAPYAPECDGSVRWDSAGIDWGVTDPVLSQKDTDAPALGEWDTPFGYSG